MDIRNKLIQLGYEDSILYENPSFDKAIIGIDACGGSVIYDFDLMVQQLTEEDNIKSEEAIEFIEYNTIRATAYMPTPKPIIFKKFED